VAVKVTNKPDFPVTDAACKEATGRTFAEWFAFLDQQDGLKIGRRESILKMYGEKQDPWWPTTIYIAYEKHHGVVKKDGSPEGYTICVTKNINAPVDKVYSVWNNRLAEWFEDEATQDLVEGGQLTCKGGTKATFTRIRENKDLRMTWEHPGCTGPMTLDVQFQDNKGKTLMNAMTSRVQTREETDGLRAAWAGALNRLKALAES
jgi:uncharacterized protein YndB with AHSA1/START domain